MDSFYFSFANPVSLILGSLAVGESDEEIILEFPDLTKVVAFVLVWLFSSLFVR